MNKLGKPGVVGALGAALLALTHSVWAGAGAQHVSVEKAPQAWLAYAQRVSETLQAALAADTETARRFNEYFSNWVDTDAGAAAPTRTLADGGPLPFDPPTLKVRVWLDRTGHVERVEFADIGDDVAEAELRSLLLAQTVGAPPPRMMKQPVVVRLSLGAEL
ncbi:hypothetical protein [Paraburkholderia humisilvae]|uniref:TonB C-terminal domain-containing protein n=1 Tax=Paraburkholderia humisilvae TaxID=627669 RepID=A0A6J5DQ49_9BURK|nr:hypothetical protein [Paraburkholderia humisilvae]CAB3755272.1 hypothetical protein LMG29542_02547 [Paraburkholderia humisilvae]